MARQSSKEMRIDPATLSALWQRLIYVAEEQAKTLVRASFTSQSAEMQDIASAVFDSQGNMLAEGITGTVGVITALLRGLKHVVKEYPRGALAAGDVLIGNDPWIWSGHTFDLAIVRPVFRQEKLIGFAATISHLTDIGGKGWATTTADIYEEGLRLPIMKLFDRGRVREDLFRILKLNVRTPDDVEGDILAQLAATQVGAHRLSELLEEYRMEGFEELGQEIFARSEAVTREAIRSVPPGIYRHEVLAGGFGEPLKIAATITADGDRLVVDYSGTSPQVPRGINCVYNYTLAHTVFSIKCALCPDIPNNEGTYRPIVVQAPEGSILNAVPPAALVSRHVLCTHINHALFGALAEALPNRVIAEGGGVGTPANIKGVDRNGKRFTSMIGEIRSMGASASRDGYSGVSFPSNMAIPSAEIAENRVPMTVLSREIVTDSGGPGKYRGGCAVRFCMRSESDMPAEIGFSQTWDFPPAGRLGGQSGNPVRRFINGSPAPADKITLEVKPGDVVIGDSAGGGGFYAPEEREPAKVLEDVIDSYVSLEKAREIYRVVIKEETMEIDWQETQRLRGAEAK